MACSTLCTTQWICSSVLVRGTEYRSYELAWFNIIEWEYERVAIVFCQISDLVLMTFYAHALFLKLKTVIWIIATLEWSRSLPWLWRTVEGGKFQWFFPWLAKLPSYLLLMLSLWQISTEGALRWGETGSACMRAYVCGSKLLWLGFPIFQWD